MVNYLARPVRPFFGSGPCVKPKEWSLESLSGFLMGRSHRSADGVICIKRVMDELRSLLNIPASHLIVFTPGSASGAIDMAFWNLLGPKPVDILEWDVFSARWANNITKELKLPTRIFNFNNFFQEYNPKHDIVFVWTGTTHGIWIKDYDWLLSPHEGLVICDATSAVMTTELPWDLLDATAFSWQKGLGGEANLGILVLTPKAMERLAGHTPSWPIPYIFCLKRNQNIMNGLFRGELINTPSMLCIQESLHLLSIFNQRGGLNDAIRRVKQNFSIIEQWIHDQDWVDFLVEDPKYRAHGPVCLKITNKTFQNMTIPKQWDFLKEMGDFLSAEKAGFECINHVLSVPSLRIWCGPTVESVDLTALLPWLSLAFETLAIKYDF